MRSPERYRRACDGCRIQPESFVQVFLRDLFCGAVRNDFDGNEVRRRERGRFGQIVEKLFLRYFVRVLLVAGVILEVRPCNDRAFVDVDNELAVVRYLDRRVKREYIIGHLLKGRDADSRAVLEDSDHFCGAVAEPRPDADLIDRVSVCYAFAGKLKLKAAPAAYIFRFDDAHILLLTYELGLSHEQARRHGALTGCGAVNDKFAATEPLREQFFARVRYYCIIPHNCLLKCLLRRLPP